MAIPTHLFHFHAQPVPSTPKRQPAFDILQPLRRRIDGLDVTNAAFAHLVCRVIPCCCPFERDISLLGRTLHIPPLCKLNPVYDELVGLRFRALAYLADTCREDITPYIC